MADVNINVNVTGVDQVDNLNDAVKATANSVDDLRLQQEALEAAFRSAQFGTQEYNDLRRQLQGVNTDLANIEASVSDLTIADKLDGAVKFGQAAAGAMAVATAATATFGDSLGFTEEQAQAASESLTSVIAAVEGFSAISTAFSKDNKLFASFLSIGQSARSTATGMNTATVATGTSTTAISTFGKVGKAALIGVGIGLFTVALSLIIEYWDQISAATKKFINSIAPLKVIFENLGSLTENFGDIFNGALAAASASVSALGSALARLVTGDFAGAQKALEGIGAAYAEGVKKSQSDKALAKTNDQIKEQIRILERRQAAGDKSLKLEQEILQKRIQVANFEISQLDKGTKAYDEAVKAREDLEDELTTKQKAEQDKRLADQKSANEKSIAESKKASDERAKQIAIDAAVAKKQLEQIEAFRKSFQDKQRAEFERDDTQLANLAETELQLNKEVYDAKQSLLIAQSQADSAALEAQLNNLKATGAGESEQAKQLEALLIEQKVKRINIEKEITLATLAEQERRALGAIDSAVSDTSSPEVLEQAEAQKAKIRAKFAVQRETLEIETSAKVADANKKVDASVSESSDERVKKVVENLQSVQQIATSVASAINGIFSTAQAGLTEQIAAVENSLASLDQQLTDAQARRDAAQQEVADNAALIEEARTTLGDYANEQTELYEKIEKAQQEGNTAALVGLRSQQNEIKKRIQSERKNTDEIEAAKAAATERAAAEEENIKRLTAEREAAAAVQQSLQQQEIELQKQKARVDRISALVSVGLAIASLAAQSAKQDFTFGVATIASIVALAGALTAAVIPLVQEGFAAGGYTGSGNGPADSSGFKPAGIVHEGEYVIPKRMVDSPQFQPLISGLESIRTGRSSSIGYATGGFVSPTSPTNTNLDVAAYVQQLSERPIVVSVVDINKENARLSSVQQQSRL